MSEIQILEVPVGRCRVALIEAADYERVSTFKWSAQKKMSGDYYARAIANRKCHYMHRVVVDCPNGFFVDHINGNGLDNRRSNLRICTHMENMQNRKMHSNNSCGLKGAYKYRRRWISRITAFGTKHELGSFDTAAEAHTAYIAAAALFHGDFARHKHPSLFLPTHSTKEPQLVKPKLQDRPLTVTERLVMDLLAGGLEPGEVATTLGRSINTISTHLTRIREKLRTRSTIHSAIVYARQNWLAHAEYESWSGIFEIEDQDALPAREELV